MKINIINNVKLWVWAIKTVFKIYPVGLSIWLFLEVLASLVPVIFIKITQLIVDAITMNLDKSDYNEIVLFLGALVLLYTLNSLSNKDMFPTVIYRNAVTRISLKVKKNIIKKINEVPLKEFDKQEFSEKLNVCCQNSDCLAQFICDGICSICILIGTSVLLVYALSYSWVFFLLCLIFMILHVIIACVNGKDWNDNRKLVEKKSRIANYYYNLTVDRNESKNIRSLDISKLISKKWLTHAHKIYDIEMKHSKKELNLEFISRLVKILANVLIMGLGFWLIQNQHFTLGMFIAIQQVFNQVYYTSEMGAYYFFFAFSQMYNIKQLKELLDMNFPDDDSKAVRENINTNNLYELKNVSFSYNDRQALKNINLSIAKGDIIALVGTNGAGKSTLVKLLLGLYEANEGSILFEGKPLNKIDRKTLLEKIGIVFQDFSRYELTLRENIAFGNIADIQNNEKLNKSAKLGGADNIINRSKNGLDTYLGKSFEGEGIDLSGGEWQRVAVSRVHLSDKEVIIMDEPAAALDPIAEYDQFMNLRNNIKNRTAILISHRIGFARLANKIVVLDNGELIEMGTHDELLKSSGFYAKMFEEQSKWYNKIYERSSVE